MEFATSLDCSNDQFKFEYNNTECCSKCKAGFGLVKQCSRDNDTECEACIPGRTFSSPNLHIGACLTCRRCKMNEHAVTLCNTTYDTVCECNIDFYYSKEKKECHLCQLCPEGFGALRSCNGSKDSVCMKCGNGMFSDKKSSISPCKTCSKCPKNHVIIEACTTKKDTVCGGLYITFRVISLFTTNYSEQGDL